MADVTIAGLDLILAGNLDDTALLEIVDKNGIHRRGTIAQLRTQILSGAISLSSTLAVAGNATFSGTVAHTRVSGSVGAGGTLNVVTVNPGEMYWIRVHSTINGNNCGGGCYVYAEANGTKRTRENDMVNAAISWSGNIAQITVDSAQDLTASALRIH